MLTCRWCEITISTPDVPPPPPPLPPSASLPIVISGASSPYYSTFYGSYEPQDQGGGCMGYANDHSQAVYHFESLPAGLINVRVVWGSWGYGDKSYIAWDEPASTSNYLTNPSASSCGASACDMNEGSTLDYATELEGGSHDLYIGSAPDSNYYTVLCERLALCTPHSPLAPVPLSPAMPPIMSLTL